jgi:hypothetical protein
MRLIRRLRIRAWYPPFLAFWSFFFVSIPVLLAIAGAGNPFRIAWYMATGWLTEPLWLAVFPPLILGPLPILLLPFAVTVARDEFINNG